MNNGSNLITLSVLYFFSSNNSLIRISKTTSSYLSFLLPSPYYNYLSVLIKLSTNFFNSQLVEVASYETIKQRKYKLISKNFLNLTKKNTQILLANFYLPNFSTYLFFFFIFSEHNIYSKQSQTIYKLDSIETLFFNSNWLEREVAEMTGIFFSNKLDSRNLLLMYGDVFSPLLKYFSSVGLYEYFYNIPNDVLIKTKLSMQN